MCDVPRNILYGVNFHLLQYNDHENTPKSVEFTKTVFGKLNASRFRRHIPQPFLLSNIRYVKNGTITNGDQSHKAYFKNTRLNLFAIFVKCSEIP